MQCDDCKYYLISPNDYYGVCKRYPENQNKNKTDFCGEFAEKPNRKVDISEYDKPVAISFVEPTQFEYDIQTDEVKPKRGRKPKNAS